MLGAYLEENRLSQEEFGRRLGVSQSMVCQWLAWLEDPTQGTRITAERAVQIDEVTGGRVPRGSLRPDIFGSVAA